MKIFRADPDAALEAAQTALTQAETRIAELTAERAAKIEQAEGDSYLVDVGKIDAEITRLQASIRAHHDRIAAMQRRQREREQADREQAKANGIANVRKRLGRRHDAARKLDNALKQLGEAFVELEAADTDAFANWPAELAAPHEYFRARTIAALSTRRQQRMVAGPVRELISLVPFDLSSEVEKRNAELVAELESAPIAEIEAA